MDQYEKFIYDLKQILDLDLRGYKRPQMERRINTLMRTLDIHSYDTFVVAMKQDKQLLDKFLNHLTINVSEFFRNISQWEVLQKQIIPNLLEKSPNLKIWSAGCSTGEEPYTTAIIFKEYFTNGNHSILATDFDQRVIKKAEEGFYPSKCLTGISPEYLQKYFISESDGFRVKDELKKIISFKYHNLLRDSFPQSLDMIICRNVVIYFTEEIKTELYRKFYSALRNGGILFTGSTEQIIHAREIGFESAGMFFYRKP